MVVDKSTGRDEFVQQHTAAAIEEKGVDLGARSIRLLK